MKTMIVDEFGDSYPERLMFDIMPKIGHYIEYNLGDGFKRYEIINIIYGNVDGETMMTIQLNANSVHEYNKPYVRRKNSQ